MHLFSSLKNASLADGIFPTRRWQRRLQLADSLSISLWAIETLCCGFYPCSDPYSATEISPSRSPRITAPLMGFSPLESSRESNSVAGIFSTRRLKVCRYRWWDYPQLGNVAGLANHSQDKSTIPVIETSAPKKHDHIDSKKANDKASQARSIQSCICVLFKKILPFQIHSFKYIFYYV